MGAYENPQPYIDTQTGQYYQRLQETISGTVARVAESYKAQQEELKKQTEKKAEEQKKIMAEKDVLAIERYARMEAIAIGSGVNWRNMFDPLIEQDFLPAQTKRLTQSYANEEDRIKSLQTIAIINGLPDRTQKVIANSGSLGTEIKNVQNKMPGTDGALSIETDNDILLAGQALMGNYGPDIKKDVIYDKENNNIKIKVTLPESSTLSFANGTKETELPESFLEQGLNNGGLIKTIPNYENQILGILDNSGLFNIQKDKTGNIIPTSKLLFSDEGTRVADKEGIFGKTELTRLPITDTKDGVKITKSTASRSVDIVKLKQSVKGQAIMAEAEATAVALLKTDPTAFRRFSNEVMLKNEEFKKQMKNGQININNAEIINDTKIQANAVEDFKNWVFFSKINQSQPVVNPEEDLAVQTDITGSNANRGREKTSGIAKPSFSKKEIEEYTKKYDKLVEGKVEYIKLPSKAGSKLFRYDTSTGRVYETNTKDEVANDRVDRTTFREYLGVPRKVQLP